MKFCGRYDLQKISESAEQYAQWLNATYKGVLDDNSQTHSTQSVLDTATQ